MKRALGVFLSIAGLMMVVLASQGQADAAQTSDDPAQVAAGEAIFAANCARCHGDDGTGTNIGRPLTGIADQGDRARHITSVTEGRGSMPAFGERLEAEEIEQALSFVRLTFVAPEPEPEPTPTPEPEPEATEEDSDAAEDTAEATTELAVTGVGTTGLAVIGLTMVVGGLQLVVFSRRRD